MPRSPAAEPVATVRAAARMDRTMFAVGTVAIIVRLAILLRARSTPAPERVNEADNALG